jgi:4-amino-4-deoxy-L-arabinose transferase-like glycosyltransferase
VSDGAGQPRTPKSQVPRLLLALLLTLSAYVQLTVWTKTIVHAPLSADAKEYFSYAWNLHEHRMYSWEPTWIDGSTPRQPDKVRTPGYPLLLLLLGKPQPNEDWASRFGLMQAAMTVGIVLFSYLLARRMAGWKWGLACGLLVATDPFVSNMAVYLLTETSFAFLLLAAFLASLRALDEGAHRGWTIAAGLCWGACSLVRPTTQFLLPTLLAGALLVPAWRRWRGSAALATLAFALVMAPWFIRNLSLPPSPPGQSLMVNSIVHGSYPDFMYEDQPETRGFPYRFDPAVPAIERDLGTALHHVAGLFAQRPLRYAHWYLLGKPYYFLSLENVQAFDIQIYQLDKSPWYDRPSFLLAGLASRALHWPLTLLALAVAVSLPASRRLRTRLAPGALQAAALAALVFGYAIAMHMVAAPFPRYAIPFRPLVYALALLALGLSWQAWRSRRA